MEMKKLSELKIYERGRVCGVQDGDRGMERRLRDVGFTEGCAVACVGRSPLGDPSAFLVRGAVVALRREDAACVEVTEA